MEKTVERSRPRIVGEKERIIQHGLKRCQQRMAREMTKTRSVGRSGHPRTVSKPKRLVRQQVQRLQQRQPRETTKARGIHATERPSASGSGSVQQRKKTFPTGRTVQEQASSMPVDMSEKQDSLKTIAWSALIVSCVALLLFGVYAFRKFSPEQAVRTVQIAQEQLSTDIKELKLTNVLERVKNLILDARLQLLLHQDYAAAEARLVKARQEFDTLRDAVPGVKQKEIDSLLKTVDAVLLDLRREPAPLDERLKSISATLDAM
jgi:hypothetical protein